MTSSKTILIDGDSIAYRCGYTSTVYEMRSAVDKFMGQIMSDCGSTVFEMYLEDWGGRKDIFRAHFAETKGYKANRTGGNLPPLLNEAREYMKRTYNAKVTQTFESEDMVLIRAYEIGIDKIIIAYIDKDLLQYPLMFYNYVKRTFITLDEDTADYNLWKQVLTGDSVDNIPGLRGWGPKKSEKLLKDKYGKRKELVSATYLKEGKEFEYFIEQYNLIRLRNDPITGILMPVTREEYNGKEET